MKYFDAIINNMVKKHKDPQTKYSATDMFASANELSFAISRLMDAQYIFSDENLGNKEISSEICTAWFSIKDNMPSETANNIAICIIKNTPLSSTQKQINEVEGLFYKAINTYTENTELSKTLTNIFFGEAKTKKFNTRAF